MRALLILAILAAVIIAARCAAPAHAQPMPPASVPLHLSGVQICHVAPAPGGFYGAKHCTRHVGRLSVYERGALAHSVDPGRDLAHYADPAAPDVPLAPAVMGDVLAWNSERDAGLYEVVGFAEIDGQTAASVVLCPVSGGHLTSGDSGSGLWSLTPDGTWALVAVFTHFQASGEAACPLGPIVWATTVP